MTVLDAWPENTKYLDKNKFLSPFTNLHKNPKMTEYQKYFNMLVNKISRIGEESS